MTVVEWLQYKWTHEPTRFLNWAEDFFIQAKAIEDEQIKKERIEAYDNGYANGQKDAYTE